MNGVVGSGRTGHMHGQDSVLARTEAIQSLASRSSSSAEVAPVRGRVTPAKQADSLAAMPPPKPKLTVVRACRRLAGSASSCSRVEWRKAE